MFVTNNNSLTREQFCQKLNKYGYEAKIDDCFSTSYLTGRYLESIKFNRRVYLIGTPGLRDELATHGIESFGVGPDNFDDKLHVEITVDPSDNVGAVVVGYDKYMSIVKVAKAMCYLRDQSVLFIGTNTDGHFPTINSSSLPGTGVMVAAVKAGTGRDPLIMGKPSPKMLELINESCPLVLDETCMVGDTLSTDIMFARNVNIKSALVLSGSTHLDDYLKFHDISMKQPNDPRLAHFAEPDVVFSCLGELVKKIFV